MGEIARKITRTRTGGQDLDLLDADNRLKLYRQRLSKILWRLKPPSKSILAKLNACADSVNWLQKIQLLGITIGLHYYGVWGDLTRLLVNKRQLD